MINPYIGPLQNISYCNSNNTLGSTLARLQSSHDVVFVMDNDRFIGLISPYYTLFLHRYPYESKTGNSVFVPPRITVSTPIYRVAEFMLATKMYTLPVFNADDEIEGVVKADVLLKIIDRSPSLLNLISQAIAINKPITANIHSNVKEIYKIMRNNDISRVILVDNNGKLAGIVARRDIQDAFSAATVRQRYTTKKHPPVRSSFDQEEVNRRDSPITEFAKIRVSSVRDDTEIKKIIRMMINSDYHSIVLTRDGGIPSGFISRHDILKALSLVKPKEEIPIIYKYPEGELGLYYMQEVIDLIERFSKKFNKKMPIRSMEIHFEQPKNTAGKTRVYNTNFHVLLKSGKLLIAKTQRRKLKDAVKEAIAEIKNQEDKSDRQKHEEKEKII